MTLWQDAAAFARLFPEAVFCGTVMAAVCSAFGVFVVLKRIVFISIALSEAATCGLALALVFQFSPLAGSALATAAAVISLAFPGRRQRLPQDVVLGTVFLLASSASVLLVAQNGFGLEAIKAMLYGDLIVSGVRDRWVLLLTGLPPLAALLLFLRPILYAFLDREGAQVMGVRCWFWEGLFFFLLGLVVSGASKSGGALLVFCLLVVTPATALLLARRLWAAIITAMALGVITTWAGLLAAYRIDLPANPTVIGLACLLLILVSGIRNMFEGALFFYGGNWNAQRPRGVLRS
jgi:zinc transport system permease protein